VVGNQEGVVGSTPVKGRQSRDVRQARSSPLVADAEAADRLEPKGEWPGAGVQRSSAAEDAPPAQRHDLTRSVASAERGKPVAAPTTGKRPVRCADGAAGNGRGSQRRPPGHRAERGCARTPRASGLTSLGCGRWRTYSPPALGSDAAMSAEPSSLALVLLPPPCPIGSRLCRSNQPVRVTANDEHRGLSRCVVPCLSGMRGNQHVPF
jgi:hypothetical protein